MDINEEYTGLAYVGRSTLRHEDEPGMGKDAPGEFDGRDEYTSEHPTLRPHIFIDFDGVSLADALMSPSNCAKGSSGIIVKYQKLIREGEPSKAQVDAWRENHTPEMLNGRDIDNLTDVSEDTVMNDILEGAPFVILDAGDISLDVPKQPEDMREELRWLEDQSDDIELDSMSDAEVRTLYDAAKSMG